MCGRSGSHRNEAKIDAVDWPSDPCTVATSDQVARGIGLRRRKPESSDASYLPFGQRYCIWKAADGSSLTIETFTDASVRATQGKTPNSTSSSARRSSGRSPTARRWRPTSGCPLDGTAGWRRSWGHVRHDQRGRIPEQRQAGPLVLLAESVVGQLRRAGAATTSTGPG